MTTIPCQYKTGRTLGAGTYAVVKEAVHIKTGKYYACKVISKQLMRGREGMIRNEITVLKALSQGHPNIVTLWDYFETQNNLYLVTDLCSGGELFDRICAKGSFFEHDAARICHVITSAVQYLHSHGIVHRDLKPENILYRSADEDADLLIADFGLSKMVDEQTMNVLTTTCGTPGYMAPEIFRRQGHGKPVDLWAIGVIAYFVCCGFTPFDRESPAEEVTAICAADFSFEPAEYWAGVSDVARDFIRKCLTVSQTDRLTADDALLHPFLANAHQTPSPASTSDLLPLIKERFDGKKTFKRAIFTVRAAKMLSEGGKRLHAEKEVVQRVQQARDEAELEAANVEHVLA